MIKISERYFITGVQIGCIQTLIRFLESKTAKLTDSELKNEAIGIFNEIIDKQFIGNIKKGETVGIVKERVILK